MKSIAADDLKVCLALTEASAHVGACFWIDFRGDAAPALTADRRTALARKDMDDWPAIHAGPCRRWVAWLRERAEGASHAAIASLLSRIAVLP